MKKSSLNRLISIGALGILIFSISKTQTPENEQIEAPTNEILQDGSKIAIKSLSPNGRYVQIFTHKDAVDNLFANSNSKSSPTAQFTVKLTENGNVKLIASNGKEVNAQKDWTISTNDSEQENSNLWKIEEIDGVFYLKSLATEGYLNYRGDGDYLRTHGNTQPWGHASRELESTRFLIEPIEIVDVKYGDEISLISSHGSYLTATEDSKIKNSAQMIGPREKWTILNAADKSSINSINYKNQIILKSSTGFLKAHEFELRSGDIATLTGNKEVKCQIILKDGNPGQIIQGNSSVGIKIDNKYLSDNVFGKVKPSTEKFNKNETWILKSDNNTITNGSKISFYRERYDISTEQNMFAYITGLTKNYYLERNFDQANKTDEQKFLITFESNYSADVEALSIDPFKSTYPDNIKWTILNADDENKTGKVKTSDNIILKSNFNLYLRAGDERENFVVNQAPKVGPWEKWTIEVEEQAKSETEEAQHPMIEQPQLESIEEILKEEQPEATPLNLSELIQQTNFPENLRRGETVLKNDLGYPVEITIKKVNRTVAPQYQIPKEEIITIEKDAQAKIGYRSMPGSPNIEGLMIKNTSTGEIIWEQELEEMM